VGPRRAGHVDHAERQQRQRRTRQRDEGDAQRTEAQAPGDGGLEEHRGAGGPARPVPESV